MNKNHVLFFIFILLSFTSCNQFLNYKEVEVIIEEEHPFAKGSGQKVWYTLSYTTGDGEILYKHINRNQKTIKIQVRRNATIYICAWALNDFSPIGGVVNPGDDKRVYLNYKNGYLVNFLQDLYLQNPRAVSSLNYTKLFSLLNQKAILFSFDKLTLARDLLNGDLSLKSIYKLDNVSVDLNQAVEGYWISENPNEGAFVISDSSYKRVSLSLSEGEHYYVNIEKGFVMLIVVEPRTKKYYIRIEKINPEFM